MPNRIDVDVSTIVSKYKSGISEWAIANELGVSRDVIKRRLHEAGIERRNVQESFTGRWKRFTHPRIGITDPVASKRMKGKNPIHMPGVAERKAISCANTYRANPTEVEKVFVNWFESFDTDFEFQKPIGKYVIDFFFPKLNICLEIDGRGHHSRSNADITRDKYLRSLGYSVLRISVERSGVGPDGRETLRFIASKYGIALPEKFRIFPPRSS
jgi:very-short-patch-repair endonuclease